MSALAYPVEMQRRVMAIVCDAAIGSGLPVARLLSPDRAKAAVCARRAAMWAARNIGGFTYVQIGRVIGDRDHHTVIDAVRRAEEMREADPAFAELLDELVRRDRERIGQPALPLSDERVLAERKLDYLGRLLGPIRAIASEAGYVVLLGDGKAGRQQIIAVPWRDEVSAPAGLAEEVRGIAAGILGCAFHKIQDGILPQRAAQGRLVWPIHLGGDVCIDFSVLPGNKEGHESEH